MLKGEFKEIFKNKKLLIYMVAVACIPVIYATIFLGSIWDPYARVDTLQVAVVNNDKPATYGDTTLSVGDDLVKNLKENDSFDWQFVSEQQAASGMADGTYLMSITIPPDFSANATTALDDSPKEMNLTYENNPGRNAIGGVIMTTGAAAVETEVRDQVTQEYVRTIFAQVGDAADGMQQAADGAEQLDDGATQLADGVSAYTDGVSQLKDGSSQLVAQNKKLNSGSSAVASGLKTLDKGASALPAQTKELDSGAQKLSEGIKLAGDGAGKLHDGTEALSSGIKTLDNAIPSASQIQQATQVLDPAVFNSLNPSQQATALGTASALLNGFATTKTTINGTIAPAVSTLNKGAATLDSSFAALEKGSAALASGTSKFASAAPALSAGVKQASDGASKLNSGVSRYTAGVSQMDEGASELTKNSGDLRDGASQLSEGSSELSTKLADGASEMAEVDPSEESIAMISTPVKLNHEEYSSVSNYAAGLAPYFLSLTLYVGAIAFSIVYPLKRPSEKVSSPVAWWFSKIAVMAGQGIFQALLLDLVMVGAMGMEVVSLPKFIAITVVLSITYVMFVNMLALMLDNVGRFIATVFLTLQLGSAAGMFPIQLSAPMYQALNKVLPMGFSANGYREALSGGLGTQNFLLNLGVLVIYMFASIGVMFFLYWHDYKKHDFVDEVDPVPAV